MQVCAGIIGFGYMGHFHWKKSQEIGGVEVKAVYDTDGSKRAEAQAAGLTAYAALQDFLSDGDVQLVYICTPNQFHAPLSAACLEAGKHVMCEKPVTLNSQELEQVIAAAEKNGRIFTCHQNRRWDEDFLLVKRVIEDGTIGSVTSLNNRVYGQRGVCFGWRADPQAGGGMLYDWGIHLIDQCLRLFPHEKVTRVYAQLQSILTPAVDDSFELQMTFESGVCAKVQVGTFCLQSAPRWFVYGDRGTLRVEDFSGAAGGLACIKEHVEGFDSVFGKDLGPSRTMAPLKPEYLETLSLPAVSTDRCAYHRNLVNAVLGKEPPCVSFDDMRRDMKIVDLAFESSRTNQVIFTLV